MEIQEYESYQALLTHKKRFNLLYDALDKHTKDAQEADRMPSYENIVERINILDQMVEVLMDVVGDQNSIYKDLEHNRNIAYTALRAYAEVYGAKLIVPEGFIDFDETFHMSASVIPQEGKTTITIEIEKMTQ